MKHTPETIEKIRKAKMGSNNPAWKGGISNPLKIKIAGLTIYEYNKVHKWVHKNKPKVKACQECGFVGKRLEAASISRQYLYDIADYRWLCVSCHRRFDMYPGRYTSDKQKAAASKYMTEYWRKWRIDNQK